MSRPATEVVYDNEEVFEVGKAKIIAKHDDDCVLVIAAGITLSQAVPAVEQLAEKVKKWVLRKLSLLKYHFKNVDGDSKM